ncbi:MAG: PLP-dependent aspartate aminotransferase family protein [Chloroflexi bacterium]|nr:PLP-dependent aspartate aminotransferase family protein [Chloroflexota bacterium]
MKETSIFTQAVHGGERAPRPDFRPVPTPIYRSSSFVYDSLQDLDDVFSGSKVGYVYARYGNPTVHAFEMAVAALEGAEDAVAYSSGMAAVYAALMAAGVRADRPVVCAADVYGATYALLAKTLAELGIATRFVDITNLAEVDAAIKEAQPTAVLCEAISNPLMKVADIPRLGEIAHRNGAQLLVDATFATPYLLRSLYCGADFAIHSATKYLAGHGDVLAGVVAASNERAALMREQLKVFGANLGPEEAWLALRGIKTLPLRMREQCANAQKVADWLTSQPQVARVNYPGLPEHPQYSLAASLFGGAGYGAMLSFDMQGGTREAVFGFMQRLRLIQPATTLGDVYSLVLYPAMSSHRALGPELRAELGIGEGLVRMSVGIEAVDDIIADLQQALAAS